MSAVVQLEFNIDDKSESEVKLDIMQKQIDEMHNSMGKVRRKIFSEVSEMKKLYAELLKQNEELKNTIREMKNEKTQWVYEKEDCLFDVQQI